MDEGQRHRLRLALERIIRLNAELRTEQVDFLYQLGDAVGGKACQQIAYWAVAFSMMDDGTVASDANVNMFILTAMRFAKLRIRDLDARCDVRPSTARQQKAIKQLGGDAKPYTYSEAERIIQLLQRKDSREPRRTKRQRKSPTGTQVHQQRTGHL